MTKKKRIVFPKEFKLEAVRLVIERGMSAAQVARDLGINPECIYRWKKEFREDRLLIALIRVFQKESRCSYGSPHVWRELRSHGDHCGFNKVTRLMRQNQLQSVFRA